eukprot:TRINITY_DN27962_c0_g1_i3.p1 TRINITY_DN27962_c0_g1~~TRINITY_DN27962_c0_g1_i3.p1  ORF type:complete len:253 (-),score=43.24 TRINITY_DN27962_c0_g1_i3:209-967(-)
MHISMAAHTDVICKDEATHAEQNLPKLIVHAAKRNASLRFAAAEPTPEAAMPRSPEVEHQVQGSTWRSQCSDTIISNTSGASPPEPPQLEMSQEDEPMDGSASTTERTLHIVEVAGAAPPMLGLQAMPEPAHPSNMQAPSAVEAFARPTAPEAHSVEGEDERADTYAEEARSDVDSLTSRAYATMHSEAPWSSFLESFNFDDNASSVASCCSEESSCCSSSFLDDSYAAQLERSHFARIDTFDSLRAVLRRK